MRPGPGQRLSECPGTGPDAAPPGPARAGRIVPDRESRDHDERPYGEGSAGMALVWPVWVARRSLCRHWTPLDRAHEGRVIL